MNPQFRLTKPAVQDIEQIADYIAQQAGLDAAERFLTKLDAKFLRIVQFPDLGRQRNEILPNMRSLSLDNYIIFYMQIDSGIDILRVVSGYRNLSSLFEDQ
jgi:toxin ParE1/3/4